MSEKDFEDVIPDGHPIRLVREGKPLYHNNGIVLDKVCKKMHNAVDSIVEVNKMVDGINEIMCNYDSEYLRYEEETQSRLRAFINKELNKLKKEVE